MPHLEAITIHARRPAELARFWSAVLGLPIDPSDAAAIMAGTLGDRESVLLGRRDGPHVWVSPADQMPETGGRVHLDVRLDEGFGGPELLELGASWLWDEPQGRWSVYTDPEGNRFCAVPQAPARPEPAESASRDVPLHLTDRDLVPLLEPRQCVQWMREAVLAAEDGRLQAPARLGADLGPGKLVFTAGALDGEWFGYRSYDTFAVDPGSQVVAVHSARDGQVTAVATGHALGRYRTGALGGLAVDTLADPDAATVGVIGAGHQAWTQLWAILGVRPVSHVSVFARHGGRLDDFVARVNRDLGVSCEAAASPESAVRDRDIVVLATNSGTPVIDPRWLKSGAHVTTVGPKQVDRSEFGLDLLAAADVIVTDSLSQLNAYEPPNLVAASGHEARIRSLGSAVSTGAERREGRPRLTLYLSVGLAGTEPHLLHRLAERARAR